MKIYEAIRQADLTANNDIETERKYAWLQTLDNMLIKDVFNKHVGTERDFVTYDGKTDPETELTVKGTYEDVYVQWLISKYYWEQAEWERYNNAALQVGETIRAFKEDFHKDHTPKSVPHLMF